MDSRATEIRTTGSDDVTSKYGVPDELMRVVEGLTSQRRHVPLWYLYDTRGSELCEEIIQTSKTYKLWQHEYSIIRSHADDIASKVSFPAILVDLGSAASSKTRLIIEALLKRNGNFKFMPVDTAKEFIENCSRQLERDYPGLTVEPFGGFFIDGVRHAAARDGAKLLLLMGTSLGDVSIHEQQKMLQDIRTQLSDQDRFVIGVDMNRDRETLSEAYGEQWIPVWRDNLISRLNKDFGGDMNHEMFRFNFEFVENPADGDTPSYVQLSLSSYGKQRVHFEKPGLDIDFQDGERIHFYEGPNTSCKWNLKQLCRLAERSGFAVDAYWTNDEENYCVICLAPAGVSRPSVSFSGD